MKNNEASSDSRQNKKMYKKENTYDNYWLNR